MDHNRDSLGPAGAHGGDRVGLGLDPLPIALSQRHQASWIAPSADLYSKRRYTDRPLHSGFYIGIALGLVTVAAVVVLVARILIYASRIGKQAQTAAEALAVVRTSTNVLPAGKQVNEHALGILEGARTAREALSS